VFALIGPKRYDVPWRELEGQALLLLHGNCPERQMEYAVADKRHHFGFAAENPRKYDVVQSLLQQESGRRVLIIGEYLLNSNKLLS